MRGCEKEDGEGWRKERNAEQSKAVQRKRMKGIRVSEYQRYISTVTSQYSVYPDPCVCVCVCVCMVILPDTGIGTGIYTETGYEYIHIPCRREKAVVIKIR